MKVFQEVNLSLVQNNQSRISDKVPATLNSLLSIFELKQRQFKWICDFIVRALSIRTHDCFLCSDCLAQQEAHLLSAKCTVQKSIAMAVDTCTLTGNQAAM